MLKPRVELEKKLIKFFINIEDSKVRQEYYLQLEEKYNISIGMSSDIITMRKDLSEYNEFVLFAITSVVDNNSIKKYFTEKEISLYSDKKLKNTKIKFPIRLPMFQVTDDQWIGVSSAQFLMQLREKQYVNYNAETQRALERMLSDGKEIFRPSVDQPALKEITQAYKDKIFIPNTISLNISQDDEDAEFTYNEETHELIIKNIKAFDIFDGYHRYLAMAANYDQDNSFDYPIELRITNFSVSKAKQFIFQEDHKTKMKKIVSKTFDQYNSGNIIIDKINSDPSSNLYNNINLTTGVVNKADMSAAINRLMLYAQAIKRAQVITKSKELKNKLNDFTEEYVDYLDHKWKRYEIYLIIYGIENNYTNQQIKKAINLITKDQIKILSNGELRKRECKIIEEVYSNV